MLIAAIVGAVAAALAGAAARTGMFDRVMHDWRRGLRRHVDDRARREAGMATLDDFEREAAELLTRLRAWIQAFAATNRRYDVNRADYDALADRLVEDFYAAQVRLLDVASEIREVIGEESYTKITHDIRAKLNKQRARRESKKI